MSAGGNRAIMIYWERAEQVEISIGNGDELWSTVDIPGDVFPSCTVAAKIENTVAEDKKLLMASPQYVAGGG